MGCTADGKKMYIQVHEKMLTEFLKSIDASIKIIDKDGEFFTVEIFIFK